MTNISQRDPGRTSAQPVSPRQNDLPPTDDIASGIDESNVKPRPLLFTISAVVFVAWLFFLTYVAYQVVSR